MSEIRIIVKTKRLFTIIESVVKKYDLKVILRGFETAQTDSRWQIVESFDSIKEIYLSGQFKHIYLSIDKLPSHAQDWNYTKDASNELIIITGGRMKGNAIEVTTIRIFAKQSEMKKQYNFLKRILKKELQKGEVYLKNRVYKNYLFDQDIWDYNVFTNLDKRKIQITKSI